jgi:hypothetical protein
MLGIGLAATFVAAIAGNFEERMTLTTRFLILASMVVAGVVEGSILGFFQWRVLRNRFPSLTALYWMGSTAAGAALCWLLGSLPGTLASAAQPEAVTMGTPPLRFIVFFILLSGLILGSILGIDQWLVLRKHANHSTRWIGANASGWAAALVWIFLGASIPSEQSHLSFILIIGATYVILSGISFGMISWSFLKNLTPRVPDNILKLAS